jgi:hypothetical protein
VATGQRVQHVQLILQELVGGMRLEELRKLLVRTGLA